MPSIGIGTGSNTSAPPFDLAIESELLRNAGTIDPHSAFCVVNPPCSCDGIVITPNSPSGANIVGLSGNEYAIVGEFEDLYLPPGAYVIREVCEILEGCCGLGVGSIGSDCGDVPVGCLIGSPATLPSTFPISFAIGSGEWTINVTNVPGFATWVHNGGLGGCAPDINAITASCSGTVPGKLIVGIQFAGDGGNLAIECDISQNCPLTAVGSAHTLNFHACGGTILDVSINASASSAASTDGIAFIGVFYEVFYPTPPDLIDTGCEANSPCTCQPTDVMVCCCPTPQAEVLYALFNAPNMPALDGAVVQVFYGPNGNYGGWAAPTATLLTTLTLSDGSQVDACLQIALLCVNGTSSLVVGVIDIQIYDYPIRFEGGTFSGHCGISDTPGVTTQPIGGCANDAGSPQPPEEGLISAAINFDCTRPSYNVIEFPALSPCNIPASRCAEACALLGSGPITVYFVE